MVNKQQIIEAIEALLVDKETVAESETQQCIGRCAGSCGTKFYMNRNFGGDTNFNCTVCGTRNEFTVLPQ